MTVHLAGSGTLRLSGSDCPGARAGIQQPGCSLVRDEDEDLEAALGLY